MEGFQTLSEFLDSPFGKPNTSEKSKFESMYTNLKNKIKIEGYMSYEDKYFIHVLIPSESNSSQNYDVVVMFFTDNESVKKQIHIRNYYVSFFSNSPSFIYQYAALYKASGYLIDFLYEKLDKEYADIIPKNVKDLSYDKSIYCACRYLLDDRFISLSKMGILTKHKKSPDSFFRGIKSFSDIKLTNELSQFEKKIDKELDKIKLSSKRKKELSHNKKTGSGNRVNPKKNTLANKTNASITKAKKIRGTKHSSKKTTRKPTR